LGLPYERNCPKNIDKCGIFIVLERFLLPVELALEGFPSRAANTMKLHKTNQGFTLTEFLVAMAVSGIVMTAIYSTLRSQQKTYTKQEQIVAMQQELRAAMYLMEREIRMAGYDPTGWATAEIQTATIDTIDTIRITQDITDNAGAGHSDGDTGDTNEDITYALFDADGDGDTDLGRNDVNGVGNQAIAENIDALNFVYLDQNGTPTTSLAEIRSVQVTILARAERADRGYTNDIMYKNQQGGTIFAPLPGDTYRRKILAAEVKCRNLGLD